MDGVTQMIVDYLSSWSQNQDLNNKQQNQTLTNRVTTTYRVTLKVGIHIGDVVCLYSRNVPLGSETWIWGMCPQLHLRMIEADDDTQSFPNQGSFFQKASSWKTTSVVYCSTEHR